MFSVLSSSRTVGSRAAAGDGGDGGAGVNGGIGGPGGNGGSDQTIYASTTSQPRPDTGGTVGIGVVASIVTSIFTTCLVLALVWCLNWHRRTRRDSAGHVHSFKDRSGSNPFADTWSSTSVRNRVPTEPGVQDVVRTRTNGGSSPSSTISYVVDDPPPPSQSRHPRYSNGIIAADEPMREWVYGTRTVSDPEDRDIDQHGETEAARQEIFSAGTVVYGEGDRPRGRHGNAWTSEAGVQGTRNHFDAHSASRGSILPPSYSSNV